MLDYHYRRSVERSDPLTHYAHEFLVWRRRSSSSCPIGSVLGERAPGSLAVVQYPGGSLAA